MSKIIQKSWFLKCLINKFKACVKFFKFKDDQYGSKSYGKSYGYKDSDDSYSSNAYAKSYSQAYAAKKYLDDLYASKMHRKSHNSYSDDDDSYYKYYKWI